MSHDSAYVKLTSPAAFEGFKTFLAHRSGLDIKVDRLSDEDRRYGEDLKGILELIDGVITGLMAAGAVFASLNVTYASVARRSSELALLRALGFSRLSVLSTILSEVMLLALIGGAAGVLGAILVFNGLETGSLIGGHPVVFRFAVTPSAIAIGLLLTLGMGFVGGLFPAIGAARRSVAAGLRGE
jgi:putative ABC transport system permease protein